MTLEELAGKAPGKPIRSDDWNTVVDAVLGLRDGLDQLSVRVEEGLTEAAAQVGELRATVEELRGEFDTFRGSVNTLIGEQYRLNLSTTRTRYALGQLAEIEAHLTALDGTPLTFADTARPWVDFVTVWGHLRPVAGIDPDDLRGGVDDRTLSVRVDANGLARVMVRAEQVDGLTESEEDEVDGALATRLPVANQRSLANVILDAATPMEANQLETFRTLGREYKRSDAVSLRRWVDTYYLRNRPVLECPIVRLPVQRWRDFRSTVLAFAKNDADPLTPDPSRGVGSIQVTFRDWVAPFLKLHFFEEVEDEVEELDRVFTAEIAPRLDDSVRNFQGQVKTFVRDKGIVGRQRSFRAIGRTLDQMTGFGRPADPVPSASPPPFFRDLKRTVRDAVDIQRNLDCTLSTENREVAVDIFSNSTLRSDIDAARIQGDLETRLGDFDLKVRVFDERAGQIKQFDSRFETLEKSLGEVNTRGIEFAEAVGEVRQLDERVTGFEGNLRTVDERTVAVPELNSRLTLIDTAVQDLNVRTQQVDAQAADVSARFSTVESQIGNLTGLNAGDVVKDLGTLQFQIKTLEDRFNV